MPSKQSPPEISSFPESDEFSRARVLNVCLGGIVENHSKTGDEGEWRLIYSLVIQA